ncbi:MAG: hypothetical protein ACLVJH_18675 [Faecalibacterium prausnitzii]
MPFAKVTKCEGVGTNNVIRAVQSGEPVSILLVPAIFLGTVLTHLCGGSAGREARCLADGRQHRLERLAPAAAEGTATAAPPPSAAWLRSSLPCSAPRWRRHQLCHDGGGCRA